MEGAPGVHSIPPATPLILGECILCRAVNPQGVDAVPGAMPPSCTAWASAQQLPCNVFPLLDSMGRCSLMGASSTGRHFSAREAIWHSAALLSHASCMLFCLLGGWEFLGGRQTPHCLGHLYTCASPKGKILLCIFRTGLSHTCMQILVATACSQSSVKGQWFMQSEKKPVNQEIPEQLSPCQWRETKALFMPSLEKSF